MRTWGACRKPVGLYKAAPFILAPSFLTICDFIQPSFNVSMVLIPIRWLPTLFQSSTTICKPIFAYASVESEYIELKTITTCPRLLYNQNVTDNTLLKPFILCKLLSCLPATFSFLESVNSNVSICFHRASFSPPESFLSFSSAHILTS